VLGFIFAYSYLCLLFFRLGASEPNAAEVASNLVAKLPITTFEFSVHGCALGTTILVMLDLEFSFAPMAVYLVFYIAEWATIRYLHHTWSTERKAEFGGASTNQDAVETTINMLETHQTEIRFAFGEDDLGHKGKDDSFAHEDQAESRRARRLAAESRQAHLSSCRSTVAEAKGKQVAEAEANGELLAEAEAEDQAEISTVFGDSTEVSKPIQSRLPQPLPRYLSSTTASVPSTAASIPSSTAMASSTVASIPSSE